VKKIQLERFSPARAFFPESGTACGRCTCICEEPGNDIYLNYFPDIEGYSCRSSDEPYPGIFPGEISFVTALYCPDHKTGPGEVVVNVGVRVIRYKDEPAAGEMFLKISAGFHVTAGPTGGTFYHDAYSFESWLWVLHGAVLIECYAAHPATGPLSGPDSGTDGIKKILMEFAHEIAECIIR